MREPSQTAPLPAQLPETAEECHALIRALAGENEQHQAKITVLAGENEQRQAIIAALARDIEQYRQRIDWLTRRLFGKKSEKFDPAKLDFFGQPLSAEETAAQEEKTPEPEIKMRPVSRRKHGRKPLPESLPRDRRVYDIPEAEKTCPDCGQPKTRIGEEVTEQLEYVPASLFVVQHVRLKYACKRCQGHVSLAEKPAQPIEKGLPGPGLLAHVVTSKYCDHLPLNRQERILARHGVELSRSTLCDWMMDAATLLEPVVRGMQKEILKSAVINTDDTPLPVQDKGKTHRAHLWVYIGDAEHPYVLYDFTWTRAREGPERILEHYEGYLQADAFSGYDNLYATKPIVEVGCWAHARRHFFDSKVTDPVRANDALLRIGEMYKVEAEARELQAEDRDLDADARDLDADARRALRREKTVPLLKAFAAWMKENANAVLPKSPIGLAIAYAQNHWTALNRFTQDGNLEIDNNAAERAIRPVCLGRNNWLFAGSERGGHAAAILFSLVQSAKRHGLDPYRYLRDLLEILPSLSHKRIALLFPDKWKALEAARNDETTRSEEARITEAALADETVRITETARTPETPVSQPPRA